MPKHTGDFFRQLATVVIGIVITFGGSALIQKCSERKVTEHMLSMVRNELSFNIAVVKHQKRILETDQAGARAIMPYIREPQLVPVDTLTKYGSDLISIRLASFRTTSFEILKNSSQMQTLNNKELLSDIFSAYYSTDAFINNIASMYQEPKKSILDGFPSALEIYYDGSYDKLFSELVKYPRFVRYIMGISSGSNVSLLIPEAERLMEEMRKVVERLDKEITR